MKAWELERTVKKILRTYTEGQGDRYLDPLSQHNSLEANQELISNGTRGQVPRPSFSA